MSGQSGEIRQYAQSWVFSLLFHALAVGSAVVFLGDLQLAPQPEPFKWDVALVEAPQSQPAQPAEQPTLSPSEPAPAKPDQVQLPVQAVQAVQPVQPVEHKVVRQEVQQEIREVKEVKPVMQESPRPVRSAPLVEALPEQPKEIVQTATAYPVPIEPAAQASPMNPAVQTHHEALPVSHHSEPVVAAVPPLAPAPAAAASPAPAQEQAVAKESPSHATPPAVQEATLRDAPARPASAEKADYGWVGKMLWDRVAMLKRYPHVARVNQLEGRVVLRAVIKDDGHLMDLAVAESSGHSVLDLDALEVVRRACPLKLRQSLGRPHVVVQVPISYRLEH